MNQLSLNYSIPGKTATSRAAAERVKPVTGRLRRLVYEFICRPRPMRGGGATNAEMVGRIVTHYDPDTDEPIAMPLQTICARRNELVESGHVRITTRRRGNGAVVVAV